MRISCDRDGRTDDDLLYALNQVTSTSDARGLLSRAMRIIGARQHRELGLSELVQICEELAVEGGSIQKIAEGIAMAALRIRPRVSSLCLRPSR
ncbi:MAG: hypothetical protein EXR68_02785 [Dehalococcoidia bacterium]|nr:hypothetical protein [Dehalococcoidia bacterium]